MDVRGFVQAGLGRVGYQLRKSGPPSEGGCILATLLPKLSIQHVIDVGANRGQFYNTVRSEACWRGRIDSFEPVADSFRYLAQYVGPDPQWHGHQVAASDVAGTATMTRYGASVFDSMASTTTAGEAIFGQALEAIGQEDVETACLDDVGLPSLGATMLKVDTQGHDWSVLAGAPRLLERVVLLSMELSFVPVYKTSVPVWAALERLDSMGFGLAAFDPVSKAEDDLRLAEGDGYFVRKTRGWV